MHMTGREEGASDGDGTAPLCLSPSPCNADPVPQRRPVEAQDRGSHLHRHRQPHVVRASRAGRGGAIANRGAALARATPATAAILAGSRAADGLRRQGPLPELPFHAPPTPPPRRNITITKSADGKLTALDTHNMMVRAPRPRALPSKAPAKRRPPRIAPNDVAQPWTTLNACPTLHPFHPLRQSVLVPTATPNVFLVDKVLLPGETRRAVTRSARGEPYACRVSGAARPWAPAPSGHCCSKAYLTAPADLQSPPHPPPTPQKLVPRPFRQRLPQPRQARIQG